MAVDKIDMRFAHKIMDEEWKKFEEVQDTMIQMQTRRVSGTLRNEFGDRKYTVSQNSDLLVTSSLKHPDYELLFEPKSRMLTWQLKFVSTNYKHLFYFYRTFTEHLYVNRLKKCVFLKLKSLLFLQEAS